MRAYQLTAWQQPPELREVPVPEPGAGEVLVRIGGAGACHSDLHLMEWPEGVVPYEVPFTLGHENAGWVEAVGAGVRTVEPGQPVAVYGPWGCGNCKRCRLGMENYCEHAAEIGAAGGGLGRDGGMADYMLVPSERLLVPLEGLDPADAAPLGDAALTPYHAIKRSLHKLEPGTTAVVIGVGGLGHMAVQLLRELSPASIVAIDLDDAQLEHAREIGADHVVRSDGEAAEAVRGHTRGKGAALVVDNVGVDGTLALAAQVTRPLADISIVGIGGGALPVSFFGVPQEASVQTTYWGTVPELREVLALAAEGRIHVTSTRYALDDVAAVYHKLEQGEVRGRAVMVP
ncbi:NAD(P)-dependent alcohol dehydrogenase [Egibacter rhizosphaerae]|uniref:alcohol dehydrogenase n=1 Tax=Egibacter rhizosphaerae TaxID=1670831 RepID=A0A411YBL9_9ACTN|nr:NAD(P)-dependent alcohol dehydrogenase [Egibacter rhizosphaerae]QBI18575.1 NAD(P)-dependent alcohol dehydrogenase [Egibacter rhizosphaerae]